MAGNLDDFLSPYVKDAAEDDGSDDVQDAPGPDNSTIRSLRAEIKRRDSDLRKAAKRLEELSEFQNEVESSRRQDAAKAAFAAKGLSEKHAGLFLKVHEGEVSDEAISTFVTQYDLAPGSKEDNAEESPATPPQFVAPTSSPMAKPAGESTGFIDRSELEALMRDNPAEAQRLYAAGRVKWSNDLKIKRK